MNLIQEYKTSKPFLAAVPLYYRLIHQIPTFSRCD